MLQLANDFPKINLALSLHAPNQTLRSQIVPSSKAWHITKIMGALDAFIARQSQEKAKSKTVMIEYVLISGINDTDEVAHELGELLGARNIVLYVIPYNPTDVPHDYTAPTRDRAVLFPL